MAILTHTQTLLGLIARIGTIFRTSFWKWFKNPLATHQHSMVHRALRTLMERQESRSGICPTGDQERIYPKKSEDSCNVGDWIKMNQTHAISLSQQWCIGLVDPEWPKAKIEPPRLVILYCVTLYIYIYTHTLFRPARYLWFNPSGMCSFFLAWQEKLSSVTKAKC